MPLLLVSGREDPVGAYGDGPAEVAERLQQVIARTGRVTSPFAYVVVCLVFIVGIVTSDNHSSSECGAVDEYVV